MMDFREGAFFPFHLGAALKNPFLNWVKKGGASEKEVKSLKAPYNEFSFK